MTKKIFKWVGIIEVPFLTALIAVMHYNGANMAMAYTFGILTLARFCINTASDV